MKANGRSPDAVVEASAPERFSALVPAWNEARLIERHIASFTALPWADCELIVCAGGDDGTYEKAVHAAEQAANVRILRQQAGQGKQSALRVCYEHAACGWIYLTDADCLFEASTLRPLFAKALEGHLAVTGGSRPLPEQLARPLVTYQGARDARYASMSGPVAKGILGRNALIHRTVAERAGAFSEPVASGTDYHMTVQLDRLGVEVAYARKSQVASEYPETPRAYVRMWRRWIKNLIVHTPRASARHMVVSVALAGAFFAIPIGAMALASAWLAAVWLLLLGVTVYRRARLVHGSEIGLAARPIVVYALLPWFTYLDQAAVLLAVMDAATPKGRARW